MKTLMVSSALLFCLASSGHAQKLSATQSSSHEGENATVCGTVASEHTAATSKGEPTFINLDSPYPHQVFTILIWEEDRKNVGKIPPIGSRICATGLITDYHGVPEMVVRSSGQLSK